MHGNPSGTTTASYSICFLSILLLRVKSLRDTTKPGLWTMDWTVDWTMDWAFLIEMSSLANNWFAAWPIFKLGGPMHPQGRKILGNRLLSHL